MASPGIIRKLVEIAFAIEPLLIKQDCTTRLEDLPGKTIYDFILSGLNVGSVFEDYARSVIKENNTELFSHFQKAVDVSNEYKHKKLINIGLLEFMFIGVKARIISGNLDECLQNLKVVCINSNNKDVLNEYEVFVKALSSSKNSEKKAIWMETYKKFIGYENIYEYYIHARNAFPDISTANYQVANEYVEGFPMIQKYITNIDEELGLIKSIENTYDLLHREKPEIKIGILADFSAVAIFLYLSYQDPNTYVLK